MKKKFATLFAAASILTAVPALAATPDAIQSDCWGYQQCQTLSDQNDSNDGWYCGRGRGHGRGWGGPGCGRHDGSCWDNQQS